ncbi:biotin--[acetyl-CoA-carboxylase] ligase [Alkalicaulis satelles]|uniref:biotin--[biotin carboxyl-carrier protein] ligase n=1 Tax=Alkalicaulis satelles TaxID=2609175 RepID=A0A5M6ZN98_9PROT|nr:biotin--[acetyl-CoA-carboxylase] ligase [Alkalicaulis satelles]KAA5805177.1 biotin--[acetyl-CoA-carboxylase] ligase [Alkalicaulis satelles]
MRFEVFSELDSTNEEARRRALAGEAGPLWIRARVQSAGRGRRGRAWTSPEGNLYCTGLYRLEAGPARAAQLSFAAALAVGDVAAGAVDASLVRLKWPNDLLIAGRKAAGILLESGAHPAGGLWLAVGIGINLAHHPDDAERPATDLSLHGERLDPDAALRTLAQRFEHWRARWAADGFAPLREAWLARAHGLGERCTARLEGETVEGVFADLAEDGALRLDLKDGARRLISAGDVFFPGAGAS